MDYNPKTLAVTGASVPFIFGYWLLGTVLVLSVIFIALIINQAGRIK